MNKGERFIYYITIQLKFLLSFIGWFFLCLLTVGLGFLLLIPYMSTAMAHFYEDLKAEYGEL